LPVLQWIPIGEIYGERFLYLPAAGLALLGASLIDPWLRAKPVRAVLLLSVLAVPSLILLQLRLPDWRSDLSLFQSAVQLHPQSARARANLGSALVEVRRLDEAARHLDQAVRLDPEDPRKQAQYGSVLVELGSVDEGVARLERAHRQGLRTKTLLKNIGIGWNRQGQYEKAATALREAYGLAPDDPGLLDALGTAERGRGNFAEADRLYRRAIEIDPERKGCYLNLIGLHYFDRRDWAAARQWGEHLFARFPDAPEVARTRQLLARDPRGQMPAPE
jgi:Flp pilus assembly protein TadD